MKGGIQFPPSKIIPPLKYPFALRWVIKFAPTSLPEAALEVPRESLDGWVSILGNLLPYGIRRG
jgi:hypothetical protein